MYCIAMSTSTKKFVIANWKMKPDNLRDAKKIFNGIKKAASESRNVETIICPPAIFLSELKRGYSGTKIIFGGQNCFWKPVGSYTGKTSPAMLADMGAKYVILGHSERRALGETNEDVNQKIHAALEQKLKVILCFGEAKRDRSGNFLLFLNEQLKVAFDGIKKEQLSNIIVAYEPIWAIGKSEDEAMKPHEIHEMMIYVRKFITKKYGKPSGEAIIVIYGGSVEPGNCEEVMVEGHAQGYLVGHASQVAKDFSYIIRTANEL